MSETSQQTGLIDAVLESVSEPLVVLDGSLRIVKLNGRFRDTFHLSAAAGSGTPLAMAVADQTLEAIVRRALEANGPERAIEYSYSAGGASRRHFLLSVTQVPGGSGNAVLSFQEASRLPQSRMQEFEDDRLASLGQMAAGIAHEINNPLAAIMGFSQLALRNTDDPLVERDLERILGEAKRSSGVVAELQSFAGVLKPRKECIDVRQALLNVLETKSHALRVNRVNVAGTFRQDLPLVLGDEQQLRQVFGNIIKNAQQAMAEVGGGTLTIEAKASGENLELSFGDDGPGIADEDLHRVFDPFFSRRDDGSTGLGLSICHGIIHEHGGSIRAERGAGQGATFVIELPAASPKESEPVEDDVGVEVSSSRMRILVVEDEPTVLEFLVRSLVEEGHDVESAASGSAVITRKDLDTFDAILLDIKMPGLSGSALFDYIRQIPGSVSSKVVFVTGDTLNIKTREFIDATGNALLAKPFTMEELTRTLRCLVPRPS